VSGAATRAGAAGLVGGVLGIAAAGAAVGLAAERVAIGRVRLRPDPEVGEPFGLLPADRTRSVLTEDGVALHVEEVGPADAAATVVFVHGYCLDMGTFHYQRRGLAGVARPPLRLVFYDQRSHGRSGRGEPGVATIGQLGRDLHRLLAHVAPRGPIVLVGHSMGGMTVMALAREHPELFGPRVVGVALLSTSTGKLASVTFGLPAVLVRAWGPLIPWVSRGLRSRATLLERTRRVGTDIAFLLTRRYAFGDPRVSPRLVSYVESMISSTPVEVVADFLPAFTAHDALSALDVLRRVETLLLVGDSDLVTPEDHSRRMAAALPDAELVVVPGAGHLALMEKAPLVNLHLRAFLHRAVRRSGGSRSRRADAGTRRDA